MAWALALAVLPAASAQAVVVHVGTRHFLGVAPRRGVRTGALPGASSATSASAGVLADNGGPVLHSSAPYLIFWTPSGESVPAGTQSLLERYFTDVAADNGTSSNVYGVARQYSDASGFADYSQSFSPATQVLTDTNAYPARDTANCPYVTSTYTHCITDAQLQAGIQQELAAAGLPLDGSGASLPANAPIYFVVLPTDVNLCFGGGSQISCAGGGSNGFCAYHSDFTDSHKNVLYAAIPTLIIGSGQNPKNCQWDGNSAVQEPNGTPADVVIKYLSHEDSETITDPLGTAWYDPSTLNEDGDNCNFYGASSPSAGSSPTAFAPTLGGSATGTLFNQLINSHDYYLQSEWSNGDGACDLRPAPDTITPSFNTRATSVSGGVAITFDPSASTSTGGFSSATWNFGTGGVTAFNHLGNTLLPVSHTYTTQGTYTVTLTLVDGLGNVTTLAQPVRVDEPPTASFAATANPGSGLATAFDASASSDPDGSVASYAWSFGDGSTGSGPSPSHTYTAPGNYTVGLTVTDSDGMVASITQVLSVAGPLASFTAPASGLVGSTLGFDAAGSRPGPGSTLSYSWTFGDGASASGATVSHAFTTAGSYPVTLTVVNDLGQSDSSTQIVEVTDELPTSAFSVSAGGVGTTQAAVAFTATGSSDPDGAIAGYGWQFGDGSTGSGASPTHVYLSAGTYTVTLTVTDSSGQTSIPVSHQVVIHAPPIAAFALTPARPVAQAPTRFDGTRSSEPEAGMAIVVYLWTFGDGKSAVGAHVAHTYARSGRYRVTLTVVNGVGLQSSTSEVLDVVKAARITRVSVRTSHTGAVLLVTVSGPGRLRLGSRSFFIARAGVARVRLRLTARELTKLLSGGSLRLRSALAFTPLYGPVCRDVVTVGFRPQESRRFNAVLLRAS